MVPGFTMNENEVEKIDTKPEKIRSPPQQLLRVTSAIRDVTAHVLDIPHSVGEDPNRDAGFWGRRKPALFRPRKRQTTTERETSTTTTAEEAAKRKQEQEKAALANEAFQEEEEARAKEEYYRRLIQKAVMGSGAVSDHAEANTKKSRVLVHDALDFLASAEGFRIQRMEPVEDPAAAISELASKPPPTPSELKEVARRERESLRRDREEMKKEDALREQARREQPSEPLPLLAKQEFRQLHWEETRLLNEAIKRLQRAGRLLSPDSADAIRVMSLQGLAQYYRRCYPIALELLEASTTKIEEAILRDQSFCAVPVGERSSAYHYMGLVLRALGRNLEAIRALKQASSHNESDPRPIKTRASIYFEMEDFEEAFAETSKACLLDREWQPPWMFLEAMQGGPERMILNETIPSVAAEEVSPRESPSKSQPRSPVSPGGRGRQPH